MLPALVVTNPGVAPLRAGGRAIIGASAVLWSKLPFFMGRLPTCVLQPYCLPPSTLVQSTSRLKGFFVRVLHGACCCLQRLPYDAHLLAPAHFPRPQGLLKRFEKPASSLAGLLGSIFGGGKK